MILMILAATCKTTSGLKKVTPTGCFASKLIEDALGD